MKGGCTLLFSNFGIISLCNSPADYWPDIFSFLMPLPVNLIRVARVAKISDRKVSDYAPVAEDFLSKNF